MHTPQMRCLPHPDVTALNKCVSAMLTKGKQFVFSEQRGDMSAMTLTDALLLYAQSPRHCK